jgi:hypothetical protein
MVGEVSGPARVEAMQQAIRILASAPITPKILGLFLEKVISPGSFAGWLDVKIKADEREHFRRSIFLPP